jgi:hypothetical protein
MGLKDIGYRNVNWIYLAQDRDQCCLHCCEPLGSIKGMAFLV